MKKRMKLLLVLLFSGILYSSSLSVLAVQNSYIPYRGEYIGETCIVEDIESTVKGTYITRATRGIAVITSKDEIRDMYGVERNAGKELLFKYYDVDASKRPEAIKILASSSSGLGCEMGPVVNIELGYTTYDKDFTLLPSVGGPVRMIFGIPEGFMDRSKTYAMLRVEDGGKISLYPDLDTNPWSVTFDTTAGGGTYTVIRY